MTIRYVLLESPQADDLQAYHAAVQPASTAELEDVIDRMVKTSVVVSRSDLSAVLEGFFATIEGMVLEGRAVRTPLANFQASIAGLFDGPGDCYDPLRHQVAVTVDPGERLRRTVRRQARVAKEDAAAVEPNPVQLLDVSSGERNGLLTPCGIGRLAGHQLKFNPDDPEQGIFFVAADGRTARVEFVGKNMPAELSFLIPALEPGEYRLQVRAIVCGCRGMRSGTLKSSLIVPQDA